MNLGAAPVENQPALRVEMTGYTFLEDPRVREGSVVVSDFFTGQVLSLGRDGSVEVVVEIDDQPSGTGWTPEGDLLVVSMLKQAVLKFSGAETGLHADLSPWATGPCNDMLVDSVGRAYVGNMGGDGGPDSELIDAHLLRVDPDGTVSVAASELRFPNGMALSPDGRQLYVAETYGARVSLFDVNPQGQLSGRRTFADFANGPLRGTAREMIATGMILPDGIALDSAGGLWIADAAGSGVVRVDQEGNITNRIPVEGLTVFAPALGGPDGRTLYLCASPTLYEFDYAASRGSQLLSCRVDIPGMITDPVESDEPIEPPHQSATAQS
ncbi:MAG: SMP-30/gluconolactonase/LRE family protein [Microbacteriaceae bacterium]